MKYHEWNVNCCIGTRLRIWRVRFPFTVLLNTSNIQDTALLSWSVLVYLPRRMYSSFQGTPYLNLNLQKRMVQMLAAVLAVSYELCDSFLRFNINNTVCIFSIFDDKEHFWWRGTFLDISVPMQVYWLPQQRNDCNGVCDWEDCLSSVRSIMFFFMLLPLFMLF